MITVQLGLKHIEGRKAIHCMTTITLKKYSVEAVHQVTIFLFLFVG